MTQNINPLLEPAQSQVYTSQFDVPSASRGGMRSILELAGLVLGVLLLISMYSGALMVSQVALLVFAIVGIVAATRDILRWRGKTPGVVSQQPAVQIGSPQVYSEVAPNANRELAKKVIKFVLVAVVIALIVCFVLPFVGLFLFVMLMMSLSGGQGS